MMEADTMRVSSGVKSEQKEIAGTPETREEFAYKFYNFSFRLFSPIVNSIGENFLLKLQSKLDSAEMDFPSQRYLSGVFFWCLLIGAAFTIIFAVGLSARISLQSAILLVLLIPTSVIAILALGITYPYYKSSKRGKRIDENLGSAFAFISAMASADVPINVIMLKLSEKKQYGEVRNEALKIARNTELLGMDIFTAMREVARSSPSVEWQKFLQGAVATSSAGARLKPYFVNKASEYQSKIRISLKKNAESVSVFAETYVTVGVAFPLFLIVILAVMGVIGQSANGSTLAFLILFSFIVLPVVNAAFILLLASVNREVQIS
jgi:flagellar protein FlaJ